MFGTSFPQSSSFLSVKHSIHSLISVDISRTSHGDFYWALRVGYFDCILIFPLVFPFCCMLYGLRAFRGQLQELYGIVVPAYCTCLYEMLSMSSKLYDDDDDDDHDELCSLMLYSYSHCSTAGNWTTYSVNTIDTSKLIKLQQCELIMRSTSAFFRIALHSTYTLTSSSSNNL